MQVTIPCELYSRMAEIPLALNPNYKHKYLGCVYIERKENQLYVVVTNGLIAAIEYLGVNVGPDASTAIVADRALINQCEQERSYNGQLEIIATPELNFTAIKTTFGWQFPGNGGAILPDENLFKTWRKWYPQQMPTESNGFMFWNAETMRLLVNASKYGNICFPEFIDTDKPIVMIDSGEWIGLFMPTSTDHSMSAAKLPDWAT